MRQEQMSDANNACIPPPTRADADTERSSYRPALIAGTKRIGAGADLNVASKPHLRKQYGKANEAKLQSYVKNKLYPERFRRVNGLSGPAAFYCAETCLMRFLHRKAHFYAIIA